MPNLVVLIPDALCVVMCGIAVVTDVRSYKIPNWLTFGGLGTAVAINAALWSIELGLMAGLKQGVGGALIGGVAASLVFAVVAGFRIVGMGDVKLMAAVGAFIRWPLALWALVYVILAGGVLAVLVAARRRRLGAVLKNSATLTVERWDGDDGNPQPMPYGIAIFIGVVWAVLARYIDALRIIG